MKQNKNQRLEERKVICEDDAKLNKFIWKPHPTLARMRTHAHACNIEACTYMYYFHVFFVEKYIDRFLFFLFTLTHVLTYSF